MYLGLDGSKIHRCLRCLKWCSPEKPPPPKKKRVLIFPKRFNALHYKFHEIRLERTPPPPKKKKILCFGVGHLESGGGGADVVMASKENDRKWSIVCIQSEDAWEFSMWQSLKYHCWFLQKFLARSTNTKELDKIREKVKTVSGWIWQEYANQVSVEGRKNCNYENEL